jgi:hypothetical protein
MSFKHRGQKSWCPEALEKITCKRVIRWAKTPFNLKNFSGYFEGNDLQYLTRRLALGDRAHKALAKMGYASSIATREVAYKILKYLEKDGIIIDVCFKLPVLNADKLDSILEGDLIPKPISKGKGHLSDNRVVYYAIYLRQIEGLTAAQIGRLTKLTRVKWTLEQYDCWENPEAKSSTSYANGRKTHRRPFATKWVHPTEFVAMSPINLSTYKQRVRHFTNVMVSKYGHLIGNAEKINEFGYEVDHILTVRDGFDRKGRQVPWQMLCHPANLQALQRSENLAKGNKSEITPAELGLRIRQFNREYGTVLIPVDANTLISIAKKYRALGKRRIA